METKVEPKSKKECKFKIKTNKKSKIVICQNCNSRIFRITSSMNPELLRFSFQDLLCVLNHKCEKNYEEIPKVN